MAAKTFWAWWTDCDFTTEERAACEAAWNAATEAAEEKFTSTNSARVEIAASMRDMARYIETTDQNEIVVALRKWAQQLSPIA